MKSSLKTNSFLIFGLLFLSTISATFAQTPLSALGLNSDVLNITAFGGYWTESQQDGYFEGFYIGYKPLKSSSNNSSFGGGVYFMYAHSQLQDYIIGQYKGRENIFEEGIQMSYWSGVTRIYDIYASMNIGGRYSDNRGDSWNGRFQGKQKNILLTSSLNFNILRRSDFLPRLQLIVLAGRSVEEMSSETWDAAKITNNSPWGKNNISWLIRTSVYDLDLSFCDCGSNSKSTLFSPKILIGGVYEESSTSAYQIGFELGVHKKSKDDFLALYIMSKLRPGNEAQITMGLSVSLNNF